ncbi:hypothetical protein P9112_000345 [Eukaryota sp. TZLM1-RC]
MNVLPLSTTVTSHSQPVRTQADSVSLSQGRSILRHGYQRHSLMESYMYRRYLHKYLHYILGIDLLNPELTRTTLLLTILAYITIPAIMIFLHIIPQLFTTLISSTLITTFTITLASFALFVYRSFSPWLPPYLPSYLPFRFLLFAFISLQLPILMLNSINSNFFSFVLLYFICSHSLFSLLITPPVSVALSLELPRTFGPFSLYSKHFYFVIIIVFSSYYYLTPIEVFVVYLILDGLVFIPSLFSFFCLFN